MKSLILSRIAALEAENATLSNGTLVLINMSIIGELKALALNCND